MSDFIIRTKKSSLCAAVCAILGGGSVTTEAALLNNTALVIQSGTKLENVSCVFGGTPPNCDGGVTTTNYTFSGSWVGMDYDGSRVVEDDEKGPITAFGNGAIHLGTTSTATGSHIGTINGSESPAFDLWEFLGHTGMHYVNSPIVEVGTHTGNTATLDFSGWTLTWVGDVNDLDLGGGIQDCGTTSDGICDVGGYADIGGTFDNGSGLATITCSQASCSNSSTFILDYAAVVPYDDPNALWEVTYNLHLEGYISSVPLPAAIWLFGSGLLGIIGAARRRKAA